MGEDLQAPSGPPGGAFYVRRHTKHDDDLEIAGKNLARQGCNATLAAKARP
jgi:hypothetical protein